MSLEALHQNSGNNARDFRIGRLFLSVQIAEDPREPWYRRTWSRQDQSGKVQYDSFASIERVTYEYSPGRTKRVTNILLGPLSLWIAVLDGEGARRR